MKLNTQMYMELIKQSTKTQLVPYLPDIIEMCCILQI